MRKLFAKDNTLKSLKELFIVFLGVLLALVGENFVQSANDRTLEKEYLSELLIELEYSVGVAIGDRDRLNRLDSSAEVLIGAIKNSNAPQQAPCNCNPCELIGNLFGIIEPDIYKSVYEELKSTGNLKVLSNSNLRQEIITYYERMLYIEKWCRDIRDSLFPYYDKQIIDLVTAGYSVNTSCNEKEMLKLLNQKEIVGRLKGARIMTSDVVGFLDERIERTNRIMEAIKKELSKK